MKFALSCAVLLLCCCKTDTPKDGGAAPEGPAEASVNTQGVAALPAARLQRLRDSVTYVDYVFYEQAFSMSMDQAAGIEYALAGVAAAPPVVTKPCPAIGRVFFKIGGRTVEEADIHFAAGCTYFAFVGADKRPTYANALTQEGKDFFNGQFRQLVPNFEPIE